METQKNIPQSASRLKKAYRRFEDIKQEFFRIQWTEEKEVITYAKVVVLATFVFGMLLYVTDVFVQRALQGVNVILRALFG
jgi:preprotein translocase subunit SecE